MATADLITSFLSNEMSPEREREFLLSVAASDSLRLELKSHMLLDRILLGQAQRARVPDGIRATIFAAAGVGAAAVTPTASAEPSQARVSRARRFSRFGGRIAMIVAAGAFFGLGYFAGGEFAASSSTASARDARNAPAVSMPATEQSPRALAPVQESRDESATRETQSAQAVSPKSALRTMPSANDSRRSAASSDIATAPATDPVSSPEVRPENRLPDEIANKPKRVTTRTTIQDPDNEATPLEQSKTTTK